MIKLLQTAITAGKMVGKEIYNPMKVEHFFDQATSTLTYVLYSSSGAAVVFDPVLNFDSINCKVTHESLDQLISFLEKNNLNLKAIVETHVHADHWTGAWSLKQKFPDADIVIGEGIKKVRDTFSFLFHEGELPSLDCFDQFVKEGDELVYDDITLQVLETPGHTPCCTSFYGHGFVFVGDVIFQPDLGTGRCDFPGGNAKSLYHSIKNKIYSLPDQTKVYTGHDYPPPSREVECYATVEEHKKKNLRLNGEMSETEFVEKRQARDEQLSLPKLIFSGLQINLRAGQLGKADSEGRYFLRTPFWQGK